MYLCVYSLMFNGGSDYSFDFTMTDKKNADGGW